MLSLTQFVRLILLDSAPTYVHLECDAVSLNQVAREYFPSRSQNLNPQDGQSKETRQDFRADVFFLKCDRWKHVKLGLGVLEPEDGIHPVLLRRVTTARSLVQHNAAVVVVI